VIVKEVIPLLLLSKPMLPSMVYFLNMLGVMYILYISSTFTVLSLLSEPWLSCFWDFGATEFL
jgi:hypothetical protein